VYSDPVPRDPPIGVMTTQLGRVGMLMCAGVVCCDGGSMCNTDAGRFKDTFVFVVYLFGARNVRRRRWLGQPGPAALVWRRLLCL
jgi:hypothetical protein